MATADRPIAAVLHDIVSNVQDIVRSEVRLAKTELKEEVSKARSAGLLCGIGALMLSFTTLFVLLAIVYALSSVVPDWAAALIVAAGVGLIAAICLGVGVKRLKTVRTPPRTAATLKENVEWAKQLTK
jgi:uncharacterized membrane protein YqjE